MSVRTYAGAIALTRTPRSAHSTARTRVSATSPAFDAQYAANLGSATVAPTEATLTIEPRLRSSMPAAAAWQSRNAARRLVAMIASQSWDDMCSLRTNTG